MTENQPHKKHNIWPADEMPCVWMEAGLVDFKLCDRHGDCENCQFDVIMRNSSMQAQATQHREAESDLSSAAIFGDLRQVDMDPDMYYGANCWYVDPVSSNQAYLGLNETAVKILPDIKDVILSNLGEIEKGQTIAWIVTASGTLCLNAPFGGKIIEINKKLSDDKQLRKERLWIVKLQLSKLAEALAPFVRGHDARHYLKNIASDLVQTFAPDVQNLGSTVGPTMQDGGTRVQSLEDLVGSLRYYKLIRSFFQQK